MTYEPKPRNRFVTGILMGMGLLLAIPICGVIAFFSFGVMGGYQEARNAPTAVTIRDAGSVSAPLVSAAAVPSRPAIKGTVESGDGWTFQILDVADPVSVSTLIDRPDGTRFVGVRTMIRNDAGSTDNYVGTVMVEAIDNEGFVYEIAAFETGASGLQSASATNLTRGLALDGWTGFWVPNGRTIVAARVQPEWNGEMLVSEIVR